MSKVFSFGAHSLSVGKIDPETGALTDVRPLETLQNARFAVSSPTDEEIEQYTFGGEGKFSFTVELEVSPEFMERLMWLIGAWEYVKMGLPIPMNSRLNRNC